MMSYVDWPPYRGTATWLNSSHCGSGAERLLLAETACDLGCETISIGRVHSASAGRSRAGHGQQTGSGKQRSLYALSNLDLS